MLTQPDGGSAVLVITSTEASLDKAIQLIMTSELLPGEDPALLPGPSRARAVPGAGRPARGRCAMSADLAGQAASGCGGVWTVVPAGAPGRRFRVRDKLVGRRRAPSRCGPARSASGAAGDVESARVELDVAASTPAMPTATATCASRISCPPRSIR